MKAKFLFTVLLTLFLMPLMAYSTDSDLYERMDEQLVIQLTDDNSTGAVDQEVLQDKRDTASELVNAHLRGRYQLPLDPAPKILADVEADILVDKLYSRRPNIEKPESVVEAQKDAMKILLEISKGNITLEDEPSPSDYSIATNKTAQDRKFDEDRFRQF